MAESELKQAAGGEEFSQVDAAASGDPNEIRTRVTGVRGAQVPGPSVPSEQNLRVIVLPGGRDGETPVNEAQPEQTLSVLSNQGVGVDDGTMRIVVRETAVEALRRAIHAAATTGDYESVITLSKALEAMLNR